MAARTSGALVPRSPPAEKASSRQEQQRPHPVRLNFVGPFYRFCCVIFLDDRRHHCDLRVDFVPLGTPSGGRIKALVMSDVSQRFRVQAKLKELIERASSAAEMNFNNGREVAPQGFAIRQNGSRFAFKPIPGASNAETVSMIRATFAQEKVVCYVLIVTASSEGKQFVLFTAEDEFGLMGSRREIIMQPTPHLGPLEIIYSDFAEGLFVGLLPQQDQSLPRR
jgi:hypothetical protein